MKKYAKIILHHFPKFFAAVITAAGLLFFPKEASDGVREGLTLLGQTVIPSLFPFLVLSSYITSGGSHEIFTRPAGKPFEILFKVNKSALPAVLLGFIGGYPIGAKMTAELFSDGRLTHNEAERLLFWNVGAGPSFCITAVGLLMLGNAKAGLILYASSVLSSLTIGFFCRFLSDGKTDYATPRKDSAEKKNSLAAAVPAAAASMLSISAWILSFACISSVINTLAPDNNAGVFIKAVLEVTTGLKAAAGKTSLPVTAAIIGFGGFSVICQISPYLDTCKVELRRFISARIINASLSAFFASQLIRLFPDVKAAITVINIGKAPVYLSYTVPVTIFLLLMCALFIIEVDNKRKKC